MMTNRQLLRIFPALVVAGSLGINLTASPIFAQEVSQQTSGQESTSQAGRTDGQIEMDVVHTLDAAPQLKEDWITAGTVQGEVTLTGTTSSGANKQLAEELASKVNGVTRVVNNLTVGDPQAAQNDGGQGSDSTSQYADPASQGSQSGQQQADSDPNGTGNYAPQPGYAPQPNDPSQPGRMPQPVYGPRPGYSSQYSQPQGPQPERPTGPVTLAKGTLVKVRTTEPLDSKRAQNGSPVEFTVVRDVYVGGVIAIPRGATIEGQVVDLKKAGALAGDAQLGLQLQTLQLGGKSFALDAPPVDVKSPNKAGRTVGNAFGGAILGALIGGAVGGGGGAAIGAGAGAVGGTAASAASPGPRVWIPAEAVLDFHLNTPVTVDPVSLQEAQRLAANAPPPSQRPTLYRRPPYPYGYYPPPPPPPGYYYRPY